MKKAFLLLMVCLTAGVPKAWAWDSRGHSAIAYIAERHLTPSAKANIAKYIDNKSIVYYASWMDHNRACKGYEMTNDWHVDYWTDKLRHDADGNPMPPVVTREIKRIVEEMKDYKNLSDSTVNVNIKYLTHMVGDMHCPVHVDFPQSRFKVMLNGKKYSFHKLWDCNVVAAKHPGWASISFPDMLDNKSEEEIARIQQGTPDDWYAETVDAARRAKEAIPEDKVIDYRYYNDVIDIADSQILNAGYRLAAVLNAIFSE